ncbi:MAG: orotate phosphoribosyltransferase [Henriciella sp.]|nr:orotate phosphoribosyltransferase [Henriciella sp.]
MNNQDVLDVFREAGALLEGHFILSSGRRSPVFLQKALVFSDPKLSEKLCAALAEKVKAQLGEIDVVVGPAMGGVIPSYEIARQLGCRAVFVERVDGAFELRRSFELHETDRVLIAEDIVTTGLSFRETVAALNKLPGTLVGGSCIIDRSGGEVDVGCPLVSLAAIKFPDYDADALPPELQSLPAYKPGSRGLSA